MQDAAGRHTEVAFADDGAAKPGSKQPKEVQNRPEEKSKEQAQGHRVPVERTWRRKG